MNQGMSKARPCGWQKFAFGSVGARPSLDLVEAPFIQGDLAMMLNSEKLLTLAAVAVLGAGG
jgi:hypothetical protein